MSDDALLRELRALEVSLHRPEIRTDPVQLDALLHDAFLEFGRSGMRYGKAQILDELPRQSTPGADWAQDWAVAELADGVALLTYRSALRRADGTFARYTNRASLWQRTCRGWQMRYHQGTPTAPFPEQ